MEFPPCSPPARLCWVGVQEGGWVKGGGILLLVPPLLHFANLLISAKVRMCREEKGEARMHGKTLTKIILS